MEPFTVVAPLVGADGYGQSAEQMILAATKLGADIQVVPWGHWDERQFTDPSLLVKVVGREAIRDRRLVVLHFLPFATHEGYGLRAERTILSTMFETDSIPQAWIPGCNNADAVIVPSEFCREAFAPYLRVPVEVVPLGVDSAFYTPVVRGYTPDARDRPPAPYTFLMAGLLHYRKGADLAVRAFREEFNGQTDVRLILKTRRGFLDAGHQPEGERIEVIDADYSREEMRALYREADAFLAPSRGEASGLTPREAMATGLPTILTDWSGLAELADPTYAFPVAPERLEPAPPKCSSYDSGVAGSLPIGNFARPSIAALRMQMRFVYEHRQAAHARGLRAAAWMAREWDWSVCAARWLDVLAKLSA